MYETKFFINGAHVSEQLAKEHWLNSETYASANRDTRDQIWRVALHGDSRGNHNPHGEIEHLNEAGIELSA